MPYKVVGRAVLHFKNGKWSIKQMTKSPENAKKAMALLEGIEHGTITPRKKKRYGK